MKRALLYAFVFLSLILQIHSQTIISTAGGGNWDNQSTWIGGTVPGENSDVIIDGTVSVTNSNAVCRNLTINTGKILQNGGGYGWVTPVVRGDLTNNGTIRNNPAGNSFEIQVNGNVYNNGVWNNSLTYFPAEKIQVISQGPGKYFDSEIRRSDRGGYTFTTGAMQAASDITFNRNVDIKWNSGFIDMKGHTLNLTGSAAMFNGTVKNISALSMNYSTTIYNLTVDGDVTLRGSCTITNSEVYFVNGTATVADTLQNGGGYGWVIPIFENIVNNGVIRNNPAGNSFEMQINGNAVNNGKWINSITYFPVEKNQTISQTPGSSFDCEVRRCNRGGYTFNGFTLSAASNVAFSRNVDLKWDGAVFDMQGHSITLTGDGALYNGTVKNAGSLKMDNTSRIYNLTVEGDISLLGSCSVHNSEVYFTKGTVTVADTLQNGGGYGWVIPIFENIVNNGVIRNNPAGNSFEIQINGNAVNNGLWINSLTYFPAEKEQTLSQTKGRYFASEVRRCNRGGYTFTTGALFAGSDLTFNRAFNLYWDNGYIDMKGYILKLTGDAAIYNGTIKNASVLEMLDNAVSYNSSFEGDIALKGRCSFTNSQVTFYGTVTVLDTMQNAGGYGWITPVFEKGIVNYGVIRNNPAGNSFEMTVRGTAENYGNWNNSTTYIQTAGKDLNMYGEFLCPLVMTRSGDPAAGSVYAGGILTLGNNLRFENGIELRIPADNSLINKGTISGNGSITNYGFFSSTHNLQWYDQLNSGLAASVQLIERNKLETLSAEFHNNSIHPQMTSGIKQWWRFSEKGEIGSYTLTLKYDKELLNGNNENTLEVYNSSDSGKTWKKISSPINITRDAQNSQITVGNSTYPLTVQPGDIVLSSGEVANTPKISMAMAGRKQIRVGPPNRYTISYWNNSDVVSDKFIIRLNTNNGVHINSVYSKNLTTGELDMIPADSLFYDGMDTHLDLLVQPLMPKEARSFDIVLKADPDPSSSAAAGAAAEPLTFTAVALWLGGAVLEEYISNTMVEGCYEMWRPVRHDQSLTDASKQALKNSFNKAVNIENGAKGIGKKAAEEILKKTGRVAVWPVMLAKDILDCMGNAINGMKDYVNGNFDKQQMGLTKVTSWDPNAKEGPAGFGTAGYIATAAPMTYTIYFENKKEATAPAWKIVIIDTLDDKVYDIGSVKFGRMSHSMGVTSQTGNIIKWTFENIELPPNVTPPQGEGWVQFTVNPKENLPTGTVISNDAQITFDLNKPLMTNLAVNTLDFDAPVTKNPAVVRTPGKNSVQLNWNVDDGTGSGGNKSMIFMATNDGPFTLAKTTNTTYAEIEVVPNINYRFYILSEDNTGNREKSPGQILDITTAVKRSKDLPTEFALMQNYPNPFNPSTTVDYAVPRQTRVRIEITDILGRRVRLLVDEEKTPGNYSVLWNGKNDHGAMTTSGIYFFRMTAEDISFTKKMIMMK